MGKMILTKRLCTATLIICVMFSTAVISSAFSSTESSKKNKTIYNHSYEFYSSLETGKTGSNKYAKGYAHIQAEQNLPGGYMGIKSMLYNSSGTLITNSTTDWSASNVGAMTSSITYSGFSGTPTVYAQGLCYIWDGTGYIGYSTYKTPNLNDYT